ncbi:hypothetical protein EDB85DRAFT_1890725 [Lactarius pseudohatsudake]|nr:hypothetical protein EDB85DRAFT_1890725 [Lactarius pseudohatsudake]
MTHAPDGIIRFDQLPPPPYSCMFHDRCIYEQRCESGRTAESCLGFIFVRLCTRVRVQHHRLRRLCAYGQYGYMLRDWVPAHQQIGFRIPSQLYMTLISERRAILRIDTIGVTAALPRRRSRVLCITVKNREFENAEPQTILEGQVIGLCCKLRWDTHRSDDAAIGNSFFLRCKESGVMGQVHNLVRPRRLSTEVDSSPPSQARPQFRLFLHSNGALKTGFFSTGFILTGLIAYRAFFFPHAPSRFGPDSVPDDPSSPSQSSPIFDVLTLEQIRDIVAPTRGFFPRDYSLNLGWNNVNMRYIIEAALLQAELLNRTLVLPSFVYHRLRGLIGPVARAPRRSANSIPISVIVNMTHFRNRQPVITASEYLRLLGQASRATNKTKTPSLFVIKNDWYEPRGSVRVDYIPEAMKRRGKLERHPGPGNYDDLRWQNSAIAWYIAKHIVKSSDLGKGVNPDDDGEMEGLLNAHGFEVLHTFQNVLDADFAKTIVSHLKKVVQRSSIRGFRDDYHDVDADVVVLAGETHIGTKPGGMRFTEELRRNRYAGTVVHSLIPPQKIFDFAEVLSSRWVMEKNPEAHVRRLKERLQTGRFLLADLHDHGHQTMCDIEGAQPDPEQATLPLPHAEDPFFVATDERDPEARRRRSLRVRPTHDGKLPRVWLAADVHGRDGRRRAAGARPRRIFLRTWLELVRGLGREYARGALCGLADHDSGLIDRR